MRGDRECGRDVKRARKRGILCREGERGRETKGEMEGGRERE